MIFRLCKYFYMFYSSFRILYFYSYWDDVYKTKNAPSLHAWRIFDCD